MNFTHVTEGNRDWGGWRARLESNQRPLASEANTLSTELRAQNIGFIYFYLTCASYMVSCRTSMCNSKESAQVQAHRTRVFYNAFIHVSLYKDHLCKLNLMSSWWVAA